MIRTEMWKKLLAGTLALSMVAGGASSAFAKDKDRDDDDDDKVKIEVKDGNRKIEIKLDLDDVEKEAAWALKYIAELAAKGVFTGYEDGTFRPKQHITRVEAITAAVRLMGLEAQAKSQAEMSTELNFKDAEKIQRKYPWAVGYISVAVENDFFAETESEVKPEKKADRLWATMLLIKALKLEEEAKAKMNTKLTFKDANEIPAGAVGYVALAVEKGLITGYEDNTFKPNKPVTRAELAALLERTDDQMPETPGHVDAQVTGTVSSVIGNSITIVKDGQPTTVNVTADTFIWRNNQKVNVTAIISGDQVKVHTVQGVATYIEVKQAATNDNTAVYTATGIYQEHRLNAQGELEQITILRDVYGQNGQNPHSVVFNVASGAQIIGGNAFSLQKDKTQLELLVIDQKVETIKIIEEDDE
ncbi:S-layer homology domain-containing protein [Paenibacillus alkalitolerans]|uniref:S-layer homology domain-containing protein n=1 Tax=Paenibacillus alkalitolerans TaxID=2799335 RepID=UPI0018F52016|nr:S-layer homology domain-containing protein [Paenibacillus alkalitolerans]